MNVELALVLIVGSAASLDIADQQFKQTSFTSNIKEEATDDSPTNSNLHQSGRRGAARSGAGSGCHLAQSRADGGAFAKDVRTVSEHIGNVYAEGELEREATIRKFRIVRQEGIRQVRREIDHYNLDVIISVGYRVKSQSGVQFRQWATRVLKEHLVHGYTLNQRRLAERGVEFEQAVDLLSRTLTNQGLVTPEGEAVASVISDYARSWSLLQGYDEQALGELSVSQNDMRSLVLDEA